MAEEQEYRLYYYLSELLEDPEITKPPKEVVPFLAWEERVTLLAAREKGGKSTLTGAAAAALSSGAAFLGQRTEPGVVLWLSFEEHISEITRRFVEFGADPEKIAIAYNFLNPMKEIPEICDEIQPDLLVWDTLGSFADAVGDRVPEPGDGPGWTRIVRRITNLSREKECAAIILHHARKSDGKYRDSTAIGANVDVILEMFGEGDGPRRLKGVGRWDIPNVSVKLQNGVFVLAGNHDLEKKILEFVRAHPGCSTREMREGVPGRNEEIQRERDRLIASGKVLMKEEAGQHSYFARQPASAKGGSGSQGMFVKREPPSEEV